MVKQLHIYAQSDWHSEAFIVGDREALIFLRDTINKALESGKAESVGVGRGINANVDPDNIDNYVFVTDGEGYEPIVMCVSPEIMEKMAFPYTDEIAADHRENVIWPGVLANKVYTIKYFNAAGEEIDEKGNLIPNGEKKSV